MFNSRHLSIQSPETMQEAWELRGQTPTACFLAGGTGLVPLLRKGLKSPQGLVDLSGIGAMAKVEEREEGLFIGAMVRLAGLAASPTIGAAYPALAKAAGLVASPQIRTVATLGGNLCQDRRCMYFNQSEQWRQSLAPCFKAGGQVCHQKPSSPGCLAVYHSDLAPVLLALGARALCFGEQGGHERPLAEFLARHSQWNGGDGPRPAMLEGVIIPRRAAGAWCGFVKHGLRTAMDFALVNAGLAWLAAGPEGGPKASFYVGSLSPTPIEMSDTQALLQAGPGGAKDWKAACIARANQEIGRKAQMILDTGSAPGARKEAMGLIGRLAGQLAEHVSRVS